MQTRIRRILFGISTIILVIIMVIFVDFKIILDNLTKISLNGILLFALTYTIAFLFRTYKLKLIFQGINLNPPYLTLYGSIGAGWAINELTPAKIGDLAKIEFIHEMEPDISLSKSSCAVAIERFIDLIILFSITCITMLYLYLNNITGTTQLNLHFFIGLGVLILGGGLAGLVILFFKTDWILNLIGKFSTKLRNYLEIFLENFIEGMKVFKKDRKKIFMVILLNIPTWFFEALTLVIFFYLAGYEINVFVIILAQLVTFFTKTIPITPGGWGVSEIAGAIIISLLYPIIPYNEILSIFILDHIIRVAYVLIYGGISTFSFNFKFKDIDLQRLDEEEIKLDEELQKK